MGHRECHLSLRIQISEPGEGAMDEQRPEDQLDEELMDPPAGTVVADLGGGQDASADSSG
jgi:hypothetical protein